MKEEGKEGSGRRRGEDGGEVRRKRRKEGSCRSEVEVEGSTITDKKAEMRWRESNGVSSCGVVVDGVRWREVEQEGGE